MKLHSSIIVLQEGPRGCGYRDKPGAMYMTGGHATIGCGALPVPLSICPCCGLGIKPARGWTWVDGERLMQNLKRCSQDYCHICPVGKLKAGTLEGRVGLLWVGVKFYPSVKAFQDEAARMGVCRRIPAVPHGFKVGEDWILLAHRRAIIEYVENDKGLPEPVFTPGVFRLFQPERIEIVVDGTEPDEVIEGYLKRGLTPVKIERIEEPQNGQLWEVAEEPAEVSA